MISQKCQYALRATFELAKRYGEGPVKIADVAEAQAIPPRFLEVILNLLKQGGFVKSRRGTEGGYFLDRAPAGIAVGEVMRFIEGPFAPVDCVGAHEECPLHGECVFLPMWERAERALAEVYDGTTFEDLLEEERRTGRGGHVASYTI